MPKMKTSGFDYEIINEKVLPYAKQLVEKFTELGHIEPEKILFVTNHASRGSKNHVVLARTTRIPQALVETTYQLCNKAFFYKIEFIAATTACMDNNQMIALLYSQLRRIRPDGKVGAPDVNDWWEMVAGLGRKWFYPDETCANLLDKGVNWQTLMGQYKKGEV